MTASQQPPRSAPRVMVIGVGNAYRGDDAVGQVVAQRLREEHQGSLAPHPAPLPGQGEGASVLLHSGEGTSLLESWRDAEAVILIDAVQSGARPGTVHRIEATEQPVPRTLLRCSTHAFGVAEAIALARALQQLPPRLILYGIEGQTFEAGAELSLAVAQAVPEVVARVLHEVCALQAAHAGRRRRRCPCHRPRSSQPAASRRPLRAVRHQNGV